MEEEFGSAFFGLPMKKHETAKQHELKNIVFRNVYNETNDEDVAIKYANIFFNIAFLKSRYSDEQEEKVLKFSPEGYKISF